MTKHVNATQAAQLLKEDSGIVVLDVRTGWEFKRSHIDGAININYLKFGFRSKVEKLDPTQRVLVHCKSGHRSQRALSRLMRAGIKNLIHLDGGIDAWKQAGLPVSE